MRRPSAECSPLMQPVNRLFSTLQPCNKNLESITFPEESNAQPVRVFLCLRQMSSVPFF
jgi:hypothetical protein